MAVILPGPVVRKDRFCSVGLCGGCFRLLMAEQAEEGSCGYQPRTWFEDQGQGHQGITVAPAARKTASKSSIGCSGWP